MFEIMARAPRVGVHCCQNRWTTGGDPHGFVLPCAGAAHGTRGGRAGLGALTVFADGKLRIVQQRHYSCRCHHNPYT